ncbi:hypothetical protein rosmuc_00670 [Roseovarius mucosus DSM 17069]|uniref:Uncharacterized protein n=1 Tax=Roseovarius mucosus DSM 17069 TaxID=1288298 RepID=A0A0A0HQE5_9RHOB|nr:hypothetical protein [Roseovarius mucosus]KGM89186.1 hypothetical protein rosmuc_00670 [Roseovarius mucosus DSM 17069]
MPYLFYLFALIAVVLSVLKLSTGLGLISQTWFAEAAFFLGIGKIIAQLEQIIPVSQDSHNLVEKSLSIEDDIPEQFKD